MGRLLILFGVLMLAAGIVMPFVGSAGLLRDVDRIGAVATADAAVLCHDDETLDTESGASTRTSASNFTTGEHITYYCVNAQGEKRDVSESFYAGLLTETGSIFGGVGSVLSSGMAAIGLSIGGIALMMAGVLMTVRTRMSLTTQTGLPFMRVERSDGAAPMGSSPFDRAPFSDSPVGVSPHSANPAPPNTDGMQANVLNLVREQLDAAYRSGQITREDYGRAIDKLINQR